MTPENFPPAKEGRTIASPKRVFATYWRYTRAHPWLTSSIVLGMLVVQISGLIAPLFMRQFFNVLAAGPTPQSIGGLLSALAFIALAWIVNWAGFRVQDTASAYLESRVRSQLLFDSFEYLIGHSYDFFLSNFAGSLTSKVGKYARAYETLFSLVVTQMAPIVVFVAGAVAILFVRNHALGIILIVWSAAFVVLQVWLARVRQPKREERAEADTRVTAALADAVGNQSTIALFAGAKHEAARFNSAVLHWRDLAWGLWRLDSWIWGVIGLFTIAIEVALLGVAALYWQRGALAVGDFVLIESYLLSTVGALMGINYQIRNFYDALADAGEMIYLLDLPHGVRDANDAEELAVSEGAIAFKEVDFYFRETRPVLEQFSLTIAGGEKVALVGPSGAGKSTIIKLLLRLYDVSGGKIEIDGMPLVRATQDSVHNAVAFVPQEPVLFHRTLRENIRYGRQSATDAEVFEAARLAHCHEFIDALPEKYETYVGERGVKLSGGERQRVAIARAILKNAPILVLDEATSSLDSESEHLIQDALSRLMEGKTVITVAHRLSTIMEMDRIVVIDQGRIVEEGRHHGLLARGGLYRKLWSIQAGGFLVDPESNPEATPSPGQENLLALLEGKDEARESAVGMRQ